MTTSIEAIFFGSLLVLTLACGPSSSGPTPVAPLTPSIVTQPMSQTAALGETATFTVGANGTAPLSYQWFWNGMALNARGAILTTPPAVSSDDGSTLSVIVTNQAGTITSALATLAVPGSPRRPPLGDLRFKDVGAFPLPLVGIQYTSVLGGMIRSFQNQVGTPLLIGGAGPAIPDGNPRNTSWSFDIFALPMGVTGRTTTYSAGVLSGFATDLAVLERADTLVTSMDLSLEQNAYAVQTLTTAGTDAYSFGTQTLLPVDLQATATRQGAAGRVITAVSLSGGVATFISYGRLGDTSTRYETSVLLATEATVGAAATSLAQQGYLLTAMGGNRSDGFLLIGTRVQGDTLPRPFRVTTQRVVDRGYTMVGSIFLSDAVTSTSGYLYFYEQ